MQTVETVNGILEKAIGALREHTGVQVESCRLNSRRDGLDYELTLRVPDDSWQLREFRLEVKNSVGNATLGEAAIRAKQTPEKFVLVGEYITQPQAEKLRELGVSFFDTAGNAYFNEPGLYIFVSGRKAKSGKKRAPRLFRPPGMKILFAFLTNPGLEAVSYREISTETNVPTPTVGVFMNDLEKAGYLVRRGASERFLVRKNELLKRWVTAFGERFRATLNPVRFRSKKHEGRWWEDIDIAKYDACWGGETGGACLTRHLKPEIATIYAESLLPRFQAQYGLVRDERGNIEILKKFWNAGEVEDSAPPLVVYADLVATADERNLETAQMIYDRYLADITKDAA